MISKTASFEKANITIMGLGLHGGGIASARFFAEIGSKVTVTDLRDREVLKPAIEKLNGLDIRFVLGRHEENDFKNADIVVKNPAVPLTSPYLKLARRIETDISIFLSLISNPVIAVTGSKGKSTVVSAVYHVLRKVYPGAKLGGNITISPLTFLYDLLTEDPSSASPVILELSSWQLSDLKGKGILKPAISAITNILPDHQNRYSGMQEYIADKKIIYENQNDQDITVLNMDDPVSLDFSRETKGRILYFSSTHLKPGLEGGFLDKDAGLSRIGKTEHTLFDKSLALKGTHNKLNLLCAGVILDAMGITETVISEGLTSFGGIAHRMEFIGSAKNISFYNDSAATIPHATTHAVKSFSRPVHLIMGGTDKELDFSVFREAASIPEGIYLLEGSATDKIITLLRELKIPYMGPFISLDQAVYSAWSKAKGDDIILFSPGCTSFGMFLNEFDRGNKFKELVGSLLKI